MTNSLPWRKGYFEHLKEAAITPIDRLPRHCFRDARGWYFDETGKRLADSVEPIGQWGLQSFRTIDDEISMALSLAEAGDHETVYKSHIKS